MLKSVAMIGACAVFGWIVYWLAMYQGAAIALGAIGFLVALAWADAQHRSDSLAKFIGSEFSLLRHLQRLPRDSD
jgi:hypothetical protein